jgi:hypothetical protein
MLVVLPFAFIFWCRPSQDHLYYSLYCRHRLFPEEDQVVGLLPAVDQQQVVGLPLAVDRSLAVDQLPEVGQLLEVDQQQVAFRAV